MNDARYLQLPLEEICFPRHKMAFISGPRQCGKTTLAKYLLKKRGVGQYFNWDEKQFRRAWTKNPLEIMNPYGANSATTPLIILDEIHKAKSWKRDLKGVYDSLETACDILVTGSAKLNVYRRGGDSLLGRYHHFHLHPFSLAEMLNLPAPVSSSTLIDELFQPSFFSTAEATQAIDQLMTFGPFPEPLFSNNKRILNIWQRERVERLIHEDLRDLSRIQTLSQIEMLVSLLPEKAAGVLSINSLREDLEVAYATMKLWVEYLKEVYYCFEVKPYSKAMPRAIKKEGKLYLWDWSEVENEGARFENMIASHLLKYAHFLTDTGLANVSLHYLKNKEKQEIDFLLVKDKEPWLPIEVKLNEESASKNWDTFFKHLPCKKGLQIIKKPGVCKFLAREHGEVIILSAEYFLSKLV
jgi:predicted AAA+ superfamily ATPase